jgi:maltose alpha-D-glucosyltransferase/alpha-amylase
LIAVENWKEALEGRSLIVLLQRMPAFLKTRRWFQGKNRAIRSIHILDSISVPDTSAQVLLGQIDYAEGDPEVYVLPGSVVVGEDAEKVKATLTDVSVATLQAPDGTRGVLYSAMFDKAFCGALLGAIARRRRFRGRAGELVGSHNRAFRKVWGESHPDLGAAVVKAEQSNTSIVFGNRFILKIYRRVEPGIHPEIEVDSFLTERGFQHIAPLTGTIEYRSHSGQSISIAVLHAFLENQGDAWHYTLDSLGRFFEAALARHEAESGSLQGPPFERPNSEFPPHVHELIGSYLDSARLLGQRTAELHLALSSDSSDPDFAPELFTDHYRQAFYHSMTGLTNQALQLLRQRCDDLTPAAQADAKRVLDQQDQIRRRFRIIPERRIMGVRTRIHGDLNLRQILHTGKDFAFVGFEGPLDRRLSERRFKRSPLRDIASLLLSLEYAAYSVLFDQVPGVTRRAEITPALEHWAGYWSGWVSAALLKSYFESAPPGRFFPSGDAQLKALLDALLLERALEATANDLAERPDGVRIPCRLILRLLESPVPEN